jgi:hypothetical protein
MRTPSQLCFRSPIVKNTGLSLSLGNLGVSNLMYPVVPKRNHLSVNTLT